MTNSDLPEQVLLGWIGLRGLLKDSRVTKNMTYNEATVMRIVVEQYQMDGAGLTPVQTILRQTRMLKSLVNRTVDKLCHQGYLVKQREGRNLFVKPVPEKLPDFLAVHQQSLDLVQHIITIIGEEDAAHFARICQKLTDANLELP